MLISVRFPRPTRRQLVLGLVAPLLALASAIGASALYLTFATPPPRSVVLPAADPAFRHRVFVTARGYHSSIFIEQAPGWQFGPEGLEDARFIEYGWGDRTFFMESNFCPLSVFNAAFLPTSTVVYVRGEHEPPTSARYGGEVYVRECSADETLRLVGILEQQMDRTVTGGRPAAFPQTPDYVGRFYPGRESYFIWWNCNEWTVRMLRDAELASSSAFVGLREQVGGRLLGFERLD